jgi:hypothetical protein
VFFFAFFFFFAFLFGGEGRGLGLGRRRTAIQRRASRSILAPRALSDNALFVHLLLTPPIIIIKRKRERERERGRDEAGSERACRLLPRRNTPLCASSPPSPLPLSHT